MQIERFFGAWRLRSIETLDSEAASLPFGDDPRGYIMYTPDGYMSATIMKSDRANFPDETYRSASIEEQGRALRSYLAYAGPFTVENDEKIVHHVEASLLPNWTGGDQTRYYAFDGDTLTLSTHPAGDETDRRTVIVWEKAT